MRRPEMSLVDVATGRLVSDLAQSSVCVVGAGGGSLRERGSEEESLDNYFWKFGHDEKAGDRANE